jgi:biopolymer transport protein ExbB
LVTTAAGLVIGITAVIFYSIFRGRVQKYIAELEAAATHLMALLSAQYNRRGGAAPQPIYHDGDEYDDYGDVSEDGGRSATGARRRPTNDRPDTHGI